MEKKYQSDYMLSYHKDGAAGNFYDKGISNKFELSIFEFEKDVLLTIAERVKQSFEQVYYLDFACGTGRIMSLFGNLFSSVRGIDTSAKQIDVAKEKVPNADFVLGNIVTNPELIEDKSANLVTAFRFFLNVEDQNREAVLKQLHRILADDGMLIVDNHMNRYSILGIIAFFMRKVLRFPSKTNLGGKKRGIINTLSEMEMRCLLKRTGFSIQKVYRLCIVPGHKSFCIPTKWAVPIEKVLTNIPLLNLISKNQIFLCQKQV